MSNWRPIASAPFDRDLQLAVIEGEQVHVLVFPCRRTTRGWRTGIEKLVDINPSHWRYWEEVETSRAT